MVMKQLLSVVAIALTMSACVSHPAQYQSLSVTLKNNDPALLFPLMPG